MATNAIGLNLLLQTTGTQAQDLLQGLQPGDVLRGRIVDLLPQGKAVISLQGQNLLAQLPAPAAGQSFQKGEVLSLEVTQSQVAKSQGGAGAPEAPAVTLRILPPTATSTQASGAVRSANSAASTLPAPSLAPAQGLPSIVVLEQALSAARVPATPANLAVVRTLAVHGLPLDPQTIQGVIQQAESLLAAEQGPSSPQSQVQGPVLPAPVQAQLQAAVPALRLSVQAAPSASARVGYQQALNAVEEALAPAPPSAAAPAIDPRSLAATPNAVPATTASPAPSVAQALQTVIEDPSPANLQDLKQAIVQAQIPATPIVTAQALPSALPVPVNPSAPKSAAAEPALTVPASPDPSALPARREAAVLLIGSLPTPEPSQPLAPRQVVEAALQLSQALEDPQSPPAQGLVKAVQSQFPQSQPAQILGQAKQALDQVVVHFEGLPAARPLAGPQALSAELEAATLPAPRQALAQFPREVVFEAVAWLKARDLPPQRPLVEAAAQFLSQGQEALQLADKVVQAKPQLPQSFLASRPGLNQALAGLEKALQQSTLKLDRSDLAEQLKAWPQASGLTLEKGLMDQLSAAPRVAQAAPAPAPTLKEALAQVQQELKEALRDPAGSTPAVAPVLEHASSQANQALQSLSALPLQAQPSPAIQSVTLPLALPLNGPLSQGQLTVSWRRGQDRSLDEKEPVNVAVALHTESLGDVKVLMQVWKGAASVVVRAQDQGTSDFLAANAAELKDGFAERTPFRLQQLGFDVASAEAPMDEPALALPASPGLNLSA